MKLLLISVFLISIIFFISIPDAFGGTYLVNIPMGAAGGIGNFEPNIIKIEQGDIIKWSTYDRGTHSITSNSGLFDSGTMEANRAGSTCFPNCKPFTYTFHDDGTYNYHCQFHSWMQGSVIVGGIGSSASAKDCTNVGCVYLDKQRYGVSEGRTVLVKIYGKVNDSSHNDFIFMTIKDPSGKMSEHKIPITSTGKFVYPLPISYDKRGMYDVIVRTGYNPSDSQVGSIWFEVVKTSAVSQSKDITPTSVILTTDSQKYGKGSIIGIAGQLIPYQSKSFEVTIKVSSPNGNIVNIAQIQPSDTGTFGSTVNTSNWTEYGNYKIKAQYENLIKSTSFAFTNTIPSGTSKTSTFLKLESVPNVFESKGSNSGAEVKFTGQLLTSDRNSVITNAKIDLIDIKFNKSVTLTTDNNGKFSTTWNWAVGSNYGVYAFYDGSNSLKFESSKSQTESFRVVQQQSIQPQSPTPSSGSFDPTAVIILVILAVIMVGIIAAVKRRKKTLIPPIPAGGGGKRRKSKPGASGNVGGATAHRTYECPKCQSGNIEQNPNGSEFCRDCGWKNY
jgi:plastocyanin